MLYNWNHTARDLLTLSLPLPTKPQDPSGWHAPTVEWLAIVRITRVDLTSPPLKGSLVVSSFLTKLNKATLNTRAVFV